MLNKLKKFNYTAVLTLLVLLINTVLPVIPNYVYADTPNGKGHYIELVSAYDSSDSDMVDDWNDESVLWFDIQIVGDINAGGLDIQLEYDTSVLTPCYYKKKNGYVAAADYDDWDIGDQGGGFNMDPGNCSLDPTAGVFQLVTTAGSDCNPGGGAVSIIRMPFIVASGTDKDALPTSLFALKPSSTAAVSGYELAIDGASNSIDDANYFGLGSGFVSPAKAIQNITVSKNPTKMNYEHGDAINLAGGEITIHYTDGTTDPVPVSMTDPEVTMTKPVSGNANVSDPQIGITYKGKTVTFNVTVTDPIDAIRLNPGLSTVNYNEGATINYAGAKVEATHRSGAKTYETVTTGLTAGTVTTDTTTASVNAANSVKGPNNAQGLPTAVQTITIGYEGKTCTATILVNDTVSSVTVLNQPTKTVYKYGEALNLAGGSLQVTTQAGNSLTPSLTDGTVTVSTFHPTVIGTQNLTAQFAGVMATGSINLTVNNYVSSITVTPPTKVTYNYGEALNLAGGSVSENMADGSTGSTGILLTNSAVAISGYNANSVGAQTITVKYTPSAGATALNGFFNVTVNDTIDDILLTPPTKTTYNIGDSIVYTGGYIKEKMKSGAVSTTTIPLTSPGVTVSPTTFTTNGTQTVTVTYKGKSKTFNVTVNDNVDQIIVTAPTAANQTYKYNDPFNLTGATITVKYLGSTADKTVTPTTAMLSDATTSGAATTTATAAQFGGNTTATKTIRLSYAEGTKTGYVDFPITVINTVTGIKIHTKPKSAYNIGDTLSLTNGEVAITRAVQSADEIVSLGTGATAASGFTVSGFNSSSAVASQPITVQYTENGVTESTSYNVSINDNITGIALQGTPVNTYNYGDTALDLTGLSLKVSKGSGDTTISLTDPGVTITGYNLSSLGNQTVTVSYGGFSDTYGITVNNWIKDIVLVSPTKTTYNIGDVLDITGGSVKTEMADGTYGTPVALNSTGVTLSGYDNTTNGIQTVTVGYEGKTKTFNVTVNDKVDSIVITAPTATNQTYKYNDPFNLTGATITVKYKGTTADKSVTPTTGMLFETGTTTAATTTATVAQFGTNTTYTKNIDLTYTEDGITQTETFPITVINTMKGIIMHTNPQTTYNVNETLKLDGGEIKVQREVGADDIIAIGTGATPATGFAVSGFNSSSAVASQSITVQYTENGETKSTSYSISVADSLISATLVGTPVSTYNYGASALNLTGLQWEVTKGSGTTYEPVQASQCTGYSLNSVGNQTVTATYAPGYTDTFNITVNDVVTGLVIVPPTKVTYDIGDSLDLTGGTVKEVYASGASATAVPLTNTGVTIGTFNNTAIGPQNISVTYKGATDNFSVTVGDKVQSVVVTAPTATQTYKYGTAFDLTGATITVKYQGTTADKTVTPTATMLFETGTTTTATTTATAAQFGSNTTYTKTIDLTYTEDGKSDTVSFPITVINTVKSISMKTNPQTSYNVNETLKLDGGEIWIEREVGVKEAMNIGTGATPNTNITVSGFNSSTSTSSQTITVQYTENGETKSTTYPITVTDSIISVDLDGTPVSTYNYGDAALDLTGLQWKVTRGSGTTYEAVQASQFSGYNLNNLGNQTVTATYAVGFTETYGITVNDYITGLQIVAPTKKIYEIGESLALAGGTVKEIMASGAATTAVPLSDASVTVGTLNSSSAGTKSIPVTYKGHTDSFNVTVNDTISNVELDGTPVNTYNVGTAALDLTGLRLKITKSSGVSYTPVTAGMCSGYNLNTVGPQTVTVTYSGFTPSYGITVNDYVKNKTFHAPTKKTYISGETIDYTGGYIEEEMASGAASQIVPLTDPSVSIVPPNMVAEGTKTVTVGYDGKTYTYQITITDPVNSIVLKGTPKDEYKIGEAIDITGLTLDVTKASGLVNIPVTTSMISGYNKNTLGNQTVTITYGGKTTTFPVTVKDYVTGIKVQPASVTADLGTTLATVLTNNNVKYIVTYKQAGDKAAVALGSGMITTSYSKFKTQAQNLTVEYTDNDVNSKTNGDKFNATLVVTLKDKVTAIALEGTPKTDYKYGESISTMSDNGVTPLALTVTKLSGTSKIPVTEAMIKGYNKTKLGNQTLTLTYSGKTIPFQTVTVSDYVKTTNFKAPTKVEYKANDKIDVTGGYLQEVMASGAVKAKVYLTNAAVTITEPNMKSSGSKIVTVTYKGKNYTYGITVTDPIVSIALDDTNAKKTYKYGDNLDVSGLKLTATKASGKTVDITPNNSMVTGYNPSKLGSQKLTVTYKGFTANYKVNVEDYVTGFELTPPTKNLYNIGQKIDLKGGEIKTIMASGKEGETIPLTDPSISIVGFNTSKVGTSKVAVKYQGYKDSFNIEVTDPVAMLSWQSLPKTTYRYGKELSLDNGTIKATTKSGVETIIPLSKCKVTGFNSTELGDQTLTVTYEGKKITYTVKVKDYVKDVKFIAPSKVNYTYEEDLDAKGGKIVEMMASGATGRVIKVTEDMITGFDSKTVGEQKLTVTNGDDEYYYTVKVIDEILDVTLKKLPKKTEYIKDESLDVTGAQLQVTRQSGIFDIDVTNDICSGFDSSEPGAKDVTISYEGKTVTFAVVVKEAEVEETTPIRRYTTRATKQENTSEEITEEPEEKEDNKVEAPVIGSVNNNNNDDNGNSGFNLFSSISMRDIATALAAILGAAMLGWLFIILAKRRKNVKVYIEEGDERVLIGKERLSRDDRELDLSKYYEKYDEEEFKIVLNKNISKKLDDKKVEVIVHDNVEETFKVDYQQEAFIYNT